jgi:hypothetical protein
MGEGNRLLWKNTYANFYRIFTISKAKAAEPGFSSLKYYPYKTKNKLILGCQIKY